MATAQPEVFVCGIENTSLDTVLTGLRNACQVTQTDDFAQVIEHFQSNPNASCLVGPDVIHPGLVLEMGGLLHCFPESILILSNHQEILWANALAMKLLGIETTEHRPRLFECWDHVEIMGPEYCPVNSVLASGQPARTKIKCAENTYFDLSVHPVGKGHSQILVGTLRDTTEETLVQQKLHSIEAAGAELGRVKPEEIREMTQQERKILLKDKVRHFSTKLLEFDTIEIRTLNQKTKLLKPLLALGMKPSAESRVLYADDKDYGVTGFVAKTGRSYLCRDTKIDPLYIEGAEGARSSLTVALKMHDEVLGTFNVESTKPGAFDEKDQQFLELFSVDVALAINTFDLLDAERSLSTAAQAQQIMCDIASPMDDLLHDATWLSENCPIDDPKTRECVQRMLTASQALRESIRKAGDSDSNSDVGSNSPTPIPDPQNALGKMKGKRIQIVDMSKESRRESREMLTRFGVIVDASANGEEALRMMRSFHYDACIIDKKTEDMGTSELYRRMQETHPHVPILLMLEFGYDQDHVLPACRKMGMKHAISKPLKPAHTTKCLLDVMTPKDTDPNS